MAEQGFETTITNPALTGESVKPEAVEEQARRELPDPKPADKHGWWWGTGRRKTAVARVRLRPSRDGQAKVQIQVSRKKFKSVEEYFSEMRDRNDVYAPLRLTDTQGKLDVFVRVHGGGYMGQAQAIRLGIARALVGYDPTFEPGLRDAGYLTRDARKVERKKYGQPGARRRFQFSKR
ncbi:MAG: 30S ribosomal protein S9 [Planctomycetota bacterium]|nr:MAG: 30S ribosomal protein S9 [Planctomycetota bacterium]